MTRTLHGLVLPMRTATDVVITRSMYRNCVSPRFVLLVYRMMTLMNWIMLYSAIYLKTPKEVVSAHLPSRISFGMQEMFGI